MLSYHVCLPLPPCLNTSREREGGTPPLSWLRTGILLPFPSLWPGGGGYAPAQPDSLTVKSPPSPRPHRPNLPSFQYVDHWREEGEIRAPSPAPSSPRSERGRKERERGMDRSRASDFHGKSNRRRSPSGTARDRAVVTATHRLPACGLPPQPPEPSAGCRVVPPPAGSEEDHPQMGVADHRHVRDPPQCETSSLLLPNPRPTSRLRGHLPPPMEGPRRIRVPTLPSRRESGGQSQRDPKSLHDSSRSLWPEKTWFANLLLLLTQPPLELLPWDHLLRQPHFNRFLGGAHALNLHTWRVSSVSSESQDFRDELRASCPVASESPLHACTSHNGSLSVVGVVEGALL